MLKFFRKNEIKEEIDDNTNLTQKKSNIRSNRQKCLFNREKVNLKKQSLLILQFLRKS
jgi:hypothetical protein